MRLRRRTDQRKAFLLATIILGSSEIAPAVIRLFETRLIDTYLKLFALQVRFSREFDYSENSKTLRHELGHSDEEALGSLQSPTKDR